MPLSSSFVPGSGKTQMLASLNRFLITEIGGGEVHDGISKTLPGGKTFWWFFDYPISAQLYPSISVADIGLFNQGERAFDRVLGHDKTTGKPIKGARNQTLVEINCWAKDTADQSDATKVVRQLRDKVNYVLVNAGEKDEDTNLFVVPPIYLKDQSDVVVGIVTLDRNANAINEKFIVDMADQNVKRYRLLVRVFWDELV